jgi:hypothetical protein
MLKIFLPVLTACFLLAACGAGPSQNPETAAADNKHFGAVITSDNAISYDELLQRMASADSMPARVTARVREVCQTKGCWMTLASDNPDQPEMRVTFLDYGFFVPKDLSGKRVTVDGYAVVENTPVDVLRHYAEDAGKNPDEIAAITEPKREMNFVATGVLVED